jgi:hypothetical protein
MSEESAENTREATKSFRELFTAWSADSSSQEIESGLDLPPVEFPFSEIVTEESSLPAESPEESIEELSSSSVEVVKNDVNEGSSASQVVTAPRVSYYRAHIEDPPLQQPIYDHRYRKPEISETGPISKLPDVAPSKARSKIPCFSFNNGDLCDYGSCADLHCCAICGAAHGWWQCLKRTFCLQYSRGLCTRGLLCASRHWYYTLFNVLKVHIVSRKTPFKQNRMRSLWCSSKGIGKPSPILHVLQCLWAMYIRGVRT